jgi:hypothetical protein
MELTVNLDKEMIRPMIISYEEQIRKDKELATKITSRMRRFSELVSQLRNAEIESRDGSEAKPATAEDKEYSEKWSMPQKIKFMLKQAGKPVTTSDLTDLLVAVDKKLGKDRGAAVKTISTLLSIGNGTDYKRVKEEGKNYYSLS